jgi:hypothetical protein
MKKIAKLLKADLNSTSDLASIAAMLQGKGRGKDTILAHITPREADILKAAGGSGTTNPETGLLEFQELNDAGGELMYEGEAGEFERGGFYGDNVAPSVVYQTELPPLGAETTPQTRSSARAIEPVVTQAQAAVAPIGTSGDAEQDVMLSSFPTVQAPSQFAGRNVALGEAALRDAVSPAPQEKSLFDKLTTEQMARLGLAGGLGLYGATQAKRGAQQSQAAAAEQRAVGAPYQAKGQELQRAAQAGELTPTGQQSLQALQARLAQGAESRGGVGAAQTAAQVEAYRQQLLAQQYDLGLKVSNIGDSIALGAIKTGLAADQALNQASANFYTNLAAIGAGIPITQTRTA